MVHHPISISKPIQTSEAIPAAYTAKSCQMFQLKLELARHYPGDQTCQKVLYIITHDSCKCTPGFLPGRLYLSLLPGLQILLISRVLRSASESRTQTFSGGGPHGLCDALAGLCGLWRGFAGHSSSGYQLLQPARRLACNQLDYLLIQFQRRGCHTVIGHLGEKKHTRIHLHSSARLVKTLHSDKRGWTRLQILAFTPPPPPSACPPICQALCLHGAARTSGKGIHGALNLLGRPRPPTSDSAG